MFHWDRLVTEVNDATEDRVVLSCESFADGGADIPRVVVETFPTRRTHIVVTLRPLARILPSAWQQYVQNGLMLSYPKWLEHIFNNRDAPRSQRFWWRHEHGALVERWLESVEPEDLTVVIADERNKDQLLNVFEAMVDLPQGILVPEPGLQNRSLTYGEAELHRRLNVAFSQQGWSEIEYAKLLRHGMVANLQKEYRPGPDEPKAVTPAWAVERAAEIGAAAARQIRALGVRVVGDLDSIGYADPDELTRGSGLAPPASLPMRAVTQAIIGIIEGTRTDARIEVLQAKSETAASTELRDRIRSWISRWVAPPRTDEDEA